MSEAKQGGRCPCCGGRVPLRAEQHGLMVESEPWRAFWRGIALPGITPMQCRYFYALLQRGYSSTAALLLLGGERCSDESVKAQISRMRAWLRGNRIPFSITNNRDWGYQLEYLGDPS